ncbi:MAG: hypothetical protein Q7S35_13595 [Candidatus Limnocylindrales bacterium]|nr:hypothetical protein [Candidatus Limnocylindrales bacterium]
MPELTVKEVRLPELHLPEIKRDEIVRTLSGVHLPEVDLAKARRARIRVPAMTLTRSDVGKLVAAVGAVARFMRPTPSRGRWLTGPFGRRSRSPIARIVQPRPRQSRWPIAFGAIIVAAFCAWALLRRPAFRQRVDEAARHARERFDELRAREVRPEGAADEPIAPSATETLVSAHVDTVVAATTM